MAALLHAGSGSVLTGLAAVRGLGILTVEPHCFDVLVPAQRRLASLAFVTIHRTSRMPADIIHEAGARMLWRPGRWPMPPGA